MHTTYFFILSTLSTSRTHSTLSINDQYMGQKSYTEKKNNKKKNEGKRKIEKKKKQK